MSNLPWMNIYITSFMILMMIIFMNYEFNSFSSLLQSNKKNFNKKWTW